MKILKTELTWIILPTVSPHRNKNSPSLFALRIGVVYNEVCGTAEWKFTDGIFNLLITSNLQLKKNHNNNYEYE